MSRQNRVSNLFLCFARRPHATSYKKFSFLLNINFYIPFQAIPILSGKTAVQGAPHTTADKDPSGHFSII